jgi:hypothetical protein
MHAEPSVLTRANTRGRKPPMTFNRLNLPKHSWLIIEEPDGTTHTFGSCPAEYEAALAFQREHARGGGEGGGHLGDLCPGVPISRSDAGMAQDLRREAGGNASGF